MIPKRSRGQMSKGIGGASVVLLAIVLMGCDGAGEDLGGNTSSPSSISVVSFEPQADGTIKTVTQAISLADYRALHEARLAQQKQQEAGLEVKRDALAYIGAGVRGVAGCEDPRTTWLYNMENGWDIHSAGGNVILGCFGGNGEWLGNYNLDYAPLPDGTTWRSAIRSMWVSNTYRAETCENPWFSGCILYNRWDQVSTGWSWHYLAHQF
jgi:hypothetical protein